MRVSGIIALGIASLALGSTAASAALLNPGFEAGTGTDADDWGEFVDGGGAGGTHLTRVGTAPLSGASHMELAIAGSTASGAGVVRLEQTTPVGSVTPGETYDFTVNARLAGALGPGVIAEMWVLYLDGDGSNGGGVKGQTIVGIQNGLTQSYQSFTASLLAPAGADSAQLRVRAAGGAFDSSDAVIYVDDASFGSLPVPEPTAAGLVLAGAAGTLARRHRRGARDAA